MKPFKTDVLDKALKEKKESRENLRKELIKQVFKALEELSSDFSFSSAFLFGSITEEYMFSESSDIDIAFEGLRDEDVIPMIAKLSSELEKNVDVVQLENHRFSDKIRKEGIEWKKKN